MHTLLVLAYTVRGKMDEPWRFDELAHAGEEHLDPDLVARYDEKAPFDPSHEIQHLIEMGLADDDVVIDLGAGTGAFAIEVAPHCDRVVAVDISPMMVEMIRDRVETSDQDNIEVRQAGFLTYRHTGRDASFVFSRNALHHLPDFWKVAALSNIAEMLRDGGILRLRDLVYSFEPSQSEQAIETWLDGMTDTAFPQGELHAHLRDEWSTYDFLMEAMLESTGFDIIDASYTDGFYAAYTCRVATN